MGGGRLLRLITCSFAFTPSHPVPLARPGPRSGPAGQVDDQLEAVFLLLRDGDRNFVVLGGLDTLFLTGRTLADICAQGGVPGGVPGGAPDPVLLFASHTHTAPSLAPDLPSLGRHDEAFYRSVVTACGHAIGDLARERAAGEIVTARYGEWCTDLNVSRRKPAWVLDYRALLRERRWRFGRRMALAANRRGVLDHWLRAIFLEDRLGQVRAVVWSLAAHPNSYPHADRVSADFPGYVRRGLRACFGAECAVVYLPGLAGSAIPDVPRHIPADLKAAVASVLPFHPTRRGFTPDLYRRWGDRLVDDILDAYDRRAPVSGPGGIALHRQTAARVFRGRRPGNSRDLHLARVRLAPGLEILGCNGEPTGAWEPLIEPEVPATALRSGYLAGAPFYLPTPQEIGEGGYEVTGFQPHFGCAGTFDPDLLGDRAGGGAAALPRRSRRPPRRSRAHRPGLRVRQRMPA